MVERSHVEELFGKLRTDPGAFFEKVSDRVQWTVMGTHPLAGTYRSRAEFLERTFDRLNRILENHAASLAIERVLIDGDVAVVEMKGRGTAINGKPFDNIYCWITTFEDGIITEVTAYVDSALVQRIIDENE